MGIQIEFNPDLALRGRSEVSNGRAPEECLPETLEAGTEHSFLKKGQRNYWFDGECPLLQTEGNQKLSDPLASILILEVTHFTKDGEVYTKGRYRITEVFTDSKIHFNSYKKIG